MSGNTWHAEHEKVYGVLRTPWYFRSYRSLRRIWDKDESESALFARFELGYPQPRYAPVRHICYSIESFTDVYQVAFLLL